MLHRLPIGRAVVVDVFQPRPGLVDGHIAFESVVPALVDIGVVALAPIGPNQSQQQAQRRMLIWGLHAQTTRGLFVNFDTQPRAVWGLGVAAADGQGRCQQILLVDIEAVDRRPLSVTEHGTQL